MRDRRRYSADSNLIIFSVLVVVLILAVYIIHELIFTPRDEKSVGTNSMNATISVAAWNLHVFGDLKASNYTLLNEYAERIGRYDIVFVQEIRDEDGSSFSSLCRKLNGYSCFESSRAGRTSIKEQYGVIYNKSKIIVNNIIDFNPDIQDRWERPPLLVNISARNKNNDVNPEDPNKWIIVYVIHTKPSNATIEIRNLERLIGKPNYPVVVIGDLNADCSFYNVSERDFKTWNWLIEDWEDTTVGKSDCAYDRIIVNGFVYNDTKSNAFYETGYKPKIIDFGIEKNITPEMSDHYLIWFKIDT